MDRRAGAGKPVAGAKDHRKVGQRGKVSSPERNTWKGEPARESLVAGAWIGEPARESQSPERRSIERRAIVGKCRLRNETRGKASQRGHDPA